MQKFLLTTAFHCDIISRLSRKDGGQKRRENTLISREITIDKRLFAVL
jgi:hypothetical protein